MFAGVDFRSNRPTGQAESCREEQAKMRLSLPTARQNEVQRCWRRAGRLLGQAGDGRPKTRFTGQVWRTTARRRAGRVGAARGQARRETRFIARSGARERPGARDSVRKRVQHVRGKDWARAGGQTRGRGSTGARERQRARANEPAQTRFTRAGSPPKRGSPPELPTRQFSNFGRPNHSKSA
ncbi:hypothetical protein GH714_043987 [Hevea brasiliensis]|uniref:Uncharacterized protein n=1 Tax=Hevea brasiliensis TaxID=3981 RepID=A0A6A6K0U2_HEVBR|nr:hypothetical protein GH714_043987 [Hevea brasiliensis]